MLYYRIKGSTQKPIPKDFLSHRITDAKQNLINIVSDFNNVQKDACNLLVCECRQDSILIAASVTDTTAEVEMFAIGLLDDLGITAVDLNCLEITVNDFAQLVHKADVNGFIPDEDSYLESLSLGSFRSCTEDNFSEWLCSDNLDKQFLYDFANDHNCGKDLVSELDRIYESPVCPSAGHPAHYVIVADDKTLIHDVIQILTSALIGVGRLHSRRVSEIMPKYSRFSNFLDLDDDGPNLNIGAVKRLYHTSSGATVVIQPGLQDKESDIAVPSVARLAEVMDLSYANRRNVLSIFIFSKSDVKGVNRLKELSKGLRLVEIREPRIFRDRAVQILRTKAKADGIENVDSLLKLIPEGEISYYIAELNALYDGWISDQHTIEAYPLYRNIATCDDDTNRTIGSAYAKLQNLIGLSSVKKVINQALDLAQFQILFPQFCPKDFKPSRHMVFAGNPGTAKTTVARLYAQIMKDNGVLPEGRLIEVGRQDLVGKYVGWTAKNVAEAFDRARGSVLFIDEAYSLCDDRSGSYGDEAINTIVQFMENRKDDTVVVFAGYPDKMQSFLDRNPGLRSRIAYHINFDDYSTDELLQILALQAKENGLRLDSVAVSEARTIIGQALSRKDFGNGRFVRNLLESARINQVSRIMDSYRSGTLDSQPTDLLLASDFCMPEELQKAMQVQRTIGFVHEKMAI